MQLIFIYRLCVFAALMVACAFGINLAQLAGQLFSFKRPWYRSYMRWTQRMFGSLMLITTYLLAPLEIIVTGHHEALNSKSFVPIIANHQIYTDWWYIWLFSWFRDAHGELKIILKSDLRAIPIFGWGMRCFEFIFFDRKWKKDQKTLIHALKRSKDDEVPMWLLIFPEGTVITDDTQTKSRNFVKKKDIEFEANHVLCPKTTGIYHILRNLQMKSEYLYDFTIGYSGSSGGYPYDIYPYTKVFFEKKGPESIHLHIDRFKISEIPGMNVYEVYSEDEEVPQVFDEWMRNRFLEKEQLMKKFFLNNEFPVESVDGQGLKQLLRIDPKFVDWISIVGLVLASVTSWSWLL